jgi:hypothetical protein
MGAHPKSPQTGKTGGRSMTIKEQAVLNIESEAKPMKHKPVIVVEHGIPMPRTAQALANEIYPWREMNVGDSFLFPPNTPFKRAQTNAGAAGRRLGMRFTVRQCVDGVRCWRVEPRPAQDNDNNAAPPDDNVPIDQLGLSVRAYNCLTLAGITSIRDLLNYPDHQLLRIPNFGTGSLAEVRRKLLQHDFNPLRRNG